MHTMSQVITIFGHRCFGPLALAWVAWNCGLKIRAVLAFHQYGRDPGDPNWIPLPLWVLDEIKKNAELAYSDRFGRRNFEYISLGCDILHVLCGRSPIQAYAGPSGLTLVLS
ncbi:hypothetical protein L6164_028352 [Bauhinia variegata]|uniref:Uncharacterized protein n=1 Tax=Bauhinia variegata TaxID=167791 RepID=A0ACB9LVU2_BAUVA|nr:hypothetical protein L6164_028352 [Bauhinia variegata]